MTTIQPLMEEKVKSYLILITLALISLLAGATCSQYVEEEESAVETEPAEELFLRSDGVFAPCCVAGAKPDEQGLFRNSDGIFAPCCIDGEPAGGMFLRSDGVYVEPAIPVTEGP